MHTFDRGWEGASLADATLYVPFVFILSSQLAIRPGTDWSSLAAYVITGVLQLVLLVLCVAWRVRQRKLGVDDFGVPIPTACEPDARARGGARAHGHEHGWEEGPRALERAREEAREGEED